MFHAAAAATTDLIYDLPLLSNSNDLDVEKEEFFNAVCSPGEPGTGRGQQQSNVAVSQI